MTHPTVSNLDRYAELLQFTTGWEWIILEHFAEEAERKEWRFGLHAMLYRIHEMFDGDILQAYALLLSDPASFRNVVYRKRSLIYVKLQTGTYFTDPDAFWEEDDCNALEMFYETLREFDKQSVLADVEIVFVDTDINQAIEQEVKEALEKNERETDTDE